MSLGFTTAVLGLILWSLIWAAGHPMGATLRCADAIERARSLADGQR